MKTFHLLIFFLTGLIATETKGQAAINRMIVGNSFMERPFDGGVPARVIHNADYTISACFPYWNDNASGNRFVAYNYFDGQNWGMPDTLGIPVTIREPALAITSSNREIIVAEHDSNLCLITRPVKGVGQWTLQYNIFGSSFRADASPRIIAAGATTESVHIICNGGGNFNYPVNGQTHPILYSRSDDGGLTWTLQDVPLSSIDMNYYRGFRKGSYNIDAKDDVVAIVFADPITDIGLLKSTDNGNTWTKTIISQFPISMFDPSTTISDVNNDGIADTITTSAGDPFVLVDFHGICHVFFSKLKIVCTTPGTGVGEGVQVDPYSDGLMYWNETMGAQPPIEIAHALDYNGNGILDFPSDQTCSLPFGNYGGGLTQFPSATIDQNDQMVVLYQTIDETADTTLWHQAHRHVYSLTGNSGGNFSAPFEILASIAQGGDGENEEAVMGCVSRNLNMNTPVILYQDDPYPGTASGVSCDSLNNVHNSDDIICSFLNVGLNSIQVAVDNGALSIFPAIASPADQISISGLSAGKYSCRIYNLMGEIEQQFSFNVEATGKYVLPFAQSSISPGLHLVEVKSTSQTRYGRFVKSSN